MKYSNSWKLLFNEWILFFKQNCWLSPPVPGSLINTSQLRINSRFSAQFVTQHFPCLLSVTCEVCAEDVNVSVLREVFGKHSPSSLPPPSPHPTNGCIYPPRGDISCLHSAVLTSISSLLTEKIAPRSFSAGIDTEVGLRQGRLVGYWLPGVKFRSGIPPKTHHFPDWMTFLLSYLHTCHLYPIVAGQTSLCSRGDPPRTLTVEIPDIYLTLTPLTRRR